MASEAISEYFFFLWRECALNPPADVCYTRTQCAHAVPMYLAHPGHATGRVKFLILTF